MARIPGTGTGGDSDGTAEEDGEESDGDPSLRDVKDKIRDQRTADGTPTEPTDGDGGDGDGSGGPDIERVGPTEGGGSTEDMTGGEGDSETDVVGDGVIGSAQGAGGFTRAQLERRFDINLSTEHVTSQGELTLEGAERLLEAGTGTDLDPIRDFTREGKLTGRGRRKVIAKKLDEQLDIDVTASKVNQSGGLTDSALREAAASEFSEKGGAQFDSSEIELTEEGAKLDADATQRLQNLAQIRTAGKLRAAEGLFDEFGAPDREPTDATRNLNRLLDATPPSTTRDGIPTAGVGPTAEPGTGATGATETGTDTTGAFDPVSVPEGAPGSGVTSAKFADEALERLDARGDKLLKHFDSDPGDDPLGFAADAFQAGAEFADPAVDAVTEEGAGPSLKTPVGVFPNIGEFERIADEAATDLTPHGGIALGKEGMMGRVQKEEEFASLAESGTESILSGEAPTGEELTGLGFQTGEILERAFVETGEDVAGSSPTQGMGPAVGQEPVGSIPGNVVGGLIGGAGMGVGSAFQLFPSAAFDASVQAEDGVTPTGASGGTLPAAVRTAESQLKLLKEKPLSTSILLGLPAVEAVPAGVRGFRSTRGTRGTVRFREITSERGARGDLPEFETRPSEATGKAVEEVRTRAAEQPDAVQRATGTDEVLFHSSPERLGPDLTVAEGGSELPGVFTSPDASPLGVTRLFGGDGPSIIEQLVPRRPDLSTKPDRIAAFEGDRIAGMPESARGVGHELRRPSGEVVERGLSRGGAKARAEGTDLQVRPQSDLPGFEFLTEQADPGTAFVRPRASRTPELEAIFPPESQFRQTGKLTAELPSGEKIPIDVFARSGETARGRRPGSDVADPVGDVSTAAEIAARSSTRLRSENVGVSQLSLGATTGLTGGRTGISETFLPDLTSPTQTATPDISGSFSGRSTASESTGSTTDPSTSGALETTAPSFDPATYRPPTSGRPTGGPSSARAPSEPTTSSPTSPPSDPSTSEPPIPPRFPSSSSSPPTRSPPVMTPGVPSSPTRDPPSTPRSRVTIDPSAESDNDEKRWQTDIDDFEKKWVSGVLTHEQLQTLESGAVDQGLDTDVSVDIDEDIL